MGGDMFGPLVKGFLVLLVIAPLGIWKLVEVIIWLVQNVHIGVGP